MLYDDFGVFVYCDVLVLVVEFVEWGDVDCVC